METNQQRVNRAKVYYNEGKYDLFLQLAELLISENIILEFLYQALSKNLRFYLCLQIDRSRFSFQT